MRIRINLIVYYKFIGNKSPVHADFFFEVLGTGATEMVLINCIYFSNCPLSVDESQTNRDGVGQGESNGASNVGSDKDACCGRHKRKQKKPRKSTPMRMRNSLRTRTNILVRYG